MKYITSLVLIVLVVVMFGCKSATTEASTKPMTLDFNPTSLTLSKADTLAKSEVKISCGCPFTMQVLAIYGDTSKITFRRVDAYAVVEHSHYIEAVPHEGINATGTYTAAISFLVKHTHDDGVEHTFYNTVQVTMFR